MKTTPFRSIPSISFEEWSNSPVFRKRNPGYKRWAAVKYNDAPSKLTPRQAVFYRNLITLALTLGSSKLPVDFHVEGNGDYWMDHGCIKIAEHAGFILPLENEENGLVGSISLVWQADIN